MEVEYSGGSVLIFSYLILIHQLDDFGSLCDNFGSEFIGCRFDGQPIAARLLLTNSAKRKRRKPPRRASCGALGRLQINITTSMSKHKIFDVYNAQYHKYKLMGLNNSGMNYFSNT